MKTLKTQPKESAPALAPESVKVSLSGNPVDNFATLITVGISMWRQAGELLVRMIEKDPAFKTKIREAHPSISEDMLIVFERIGRKQLYPMLLANNSLGARALSAMPYEVQEKYATRPIPVVVRNNGASQVVEKRVEELTKQQCEQVFNGVRILTPKEQEQEMARRREEHAAPSAQVLAAVPKKAPTVQRLGCYRVSVARDGVITFTPTEETWKAQQVKVDRPASSAGAFTGDVLFFTNHP